MPSHAVDVWVQELPNCNISLYTITRILLIYINKNKCTVIVMIWTLNLKKKKQLFNKEKLPLKQL